MSVSKEIISLKIRASGVVPVFYHPDMDVLLRVVSISYQCGLRVFEFMHQRDNKGLRFFEHLSGRVDEFPDLTLGVGTVLDATMTERYIKAGANYVASPFLRPDMGLVAKDHNVPWMPGCTTVVEIEKAKSLGATFVNVLPGNVLGSEFITPIAKLYPELKLIPSGISDLRAASLTKWYESGILGIKLGPQLFTKEDIAAKDWSRITNNLKDLLTSIKRIQSSLKLDSVTE